ncbi:MAG: SusC/RagA family TonB-linked outer membrane protein, partial [Prevotellaceae bacterium]|nr:SusC/RagA family TonB-linked outer membrane protein [Prevotellaceae bacterium]
MKRLLFIFTILSCSIIVQAQNILKGKVTDSGGEAMIGAQVKWKDAKTGTITNIDGMFSIAKDDNATTLVVSCIGFKTSEINIAKGQSNVNIVLKDDAQHLDELVVVGYGVQKKNSLTGSVETIKAADLLMAPTSNLDQALSGQAAGLQVMQTTGDPSTAKESSIHIRGINESPLLVIDGVPRFGTNTSDGELRMSDLNPDDIESVTILKDAAASAVYGARAANGVILIQTKRSQGEQKLKVNYRGQFNLQQAAHLPNFLNAYEFALLRNRAVENTPSTTIVPFSDEQLEQIRNHTNPNVYGDENILDYLDKTGWNTTHSVSASGGVKSVNYYLSFGYADSKGLYNGIGRKRLNYMAKIDVKLNKDLTFALDFTGTRSNARNSSYSTIESAYSYSPLQVTRFTNGYLSSDNGGNALININGLGGYIKDVSKMGTINATLRWDIPWVKGLNAYLRGTFDDNNRIETRFSKPVTLYTYDPDTDTYAEDPNTVYPAAKVSYQQQDAFYDSQLYELGINYNRTFNEKHNVGGMLIANYQRTHNLSMRGENQDKGIVPEIMGTVQTAQLYGTETKNQRASLIGRANYGYDDKYFFEFSFRVDGSNNFSPDNRWGFFPSFSAAWVLSNEKFFKDWKQKVISNVKLRASTGWLGNDGLASAYSYLKTYIETPNNGYSIGGNFRPGLMLQGNPNPNLTWGKTHDYNLATDLGFWGGRIGLSFEYFVRYDTDMITSAPEYLYPPS